MTSVDGSSWTQAAEQGSLTATGIAYGYDTYIVVAANGAVRESLDKSNWTPVALDTSGTPLSKGNLGGVAYGNNRFVAVGGQGDILRSDEYPSAELKDITGHAGALQPVCFDSATTAYEVNAGALAPK